MTTEVAAKIEAFFSGYPLRKYPKGQIIAFANEKPDCVFYLKSGKVKSYDISYRGDEIILNIFKPPAFFPMSVPLNNTDNPYFYETEEPTEAHCAPGPEVVKFLESNPDVTLDLLSRLYRGLDGVLGRITHLMAGSAHSRVIYELLLEARRFGTAQPEGSWLITISEKDLGARAGLSRETVNRELHKLKQAGLIGIGRTDMTIPNLEDLAARLSQDI